MVLEARVQTRSLIQLEVVAFGASQVLREFVERAFGEGERRIRSQRDQLPSDAVVRARHMVRAGSSGLIADLHLLVLGLRQVEADDLDRVVVFFRILKVLIITLELWFRFEDSRSSLILTRSTA